jgi:hypothetical protein
MARMKREFTPSGKYSVDFNANKESQRIGALMGLEGFENFACGATPAGLCMSSTVCSDARTPAGALILTSMSEVARVGPPSHLDFGMDRG